MHFLVFILADAFGIIFIIVHSMHFHIGILVLWVYIHNGTNTYPSLSESKEEKETSIHW